MTWNLFLTLRVPFRAINIDYVHIRTHGRRLSLWVTVEDVVSLSLSLSRLPLFSIPLLLFTPCLSVGVGWSENVCTTYHHVTFPTSVCTLCLRMIVVSHVLQSLRSSWCPGLGSLLASALLLCMAPEPGTDYIHVSSMTRTNAFCIQAPAQDPPVPTLNWCSCGCRVPSPGAVPIV